VYDISSCKFKRALTVSGLQYSAQNDLAFCTARQCLYLSDYDGRRVHRLKLPTAMSKWSIADHPYGVSVSRENTVLVTCRQAKKLLEYSGGGRFLRAIVLGVTNPWHGVQTSADRFLVAHGYHGDAARGLLVTDAAGRVRHSSKYSDERLNLPRHCAVDDSGRVYVVDAGDQRVIAMSPDLQYLGDVASRGRDDLAWWPVRICLDPSSERLFVADSNTESGRVVAYNIVTG